MRKKKSTFGKIFALLVAFTMLATSFPYTAVAGIGAGNDVGDATNLIAISPTEILLLPGESEQLEYILAAALGEYRIEWALTGDVAPGTEITADGLLTVCESEAVGVPISVTATVYVPADAPDDVYDDDYADDDTDVLFPDDDYADDDTDVYIPDDDYADDSDVHVPDDDDADMYPPPCDVPDDDSAANDGSDAPDNDDASDDSAAAGNDDASDDSAAASDNGDTSDDSDAASDNGDISDDSDAADNGDVSDDSAAADNGDTSDDSSAPDNGDASDDSSASAAPDNGSVAGDDSDAFAPDASGSDSDSANGVYVLGAYIDDANVATYANDSTDAADATDSIAATDANYATDAIDASSPAYVADGNAYAIDAAWVAIAYVSVPVHVISGIVPTAILAPGMMWCLSNHPDTPAHGFMSDTAHSASTEIFARTSDATIAINGGVLTLAGRTGGANAIGVNIEAMGLNPDVNEYRVRIAGRIDNVTATGGVFRIAGRDPNVTIIDVPILPGGEFDVTIDLPASNWPGAGGVGYPILRLLTNTNAAVQTNDIIIDTFTVSTVVWCLSDHPDAPAHGFMSDTAHSASTEIFARTSDATIAINGGVMTLAGRTGGANAIGVNIEAMGLNPDVNEYRVRIAGRIDGVTATGGVFRIAGRDPNVTIIDEPILPGGEFDVTIILPATNWPGAVMGYPILRLLTNTNAAVQTNDIIIETFTVYGEVGDNPLREAAAAVRGALNSFDASNDTTAAEVLTAAQGAVTAAALPVTITAAWVAAPTITPAQVGVAGSIVGTIRLTQNPTIDIDVSLAIPALAAPPTFGYLFDLQAYLATRTIGENLRLAGASPYFVSTHPTEAVEILVQDAGLGSPAHVTRMLHVDRQATNATRGLVLQGVDLEEGDVITITGVLHAPAVPAAGLNMRLQSVATTGYMPNNPGGTLGVGAFEFVYTVSADHAGRANQAMRILAHGEGVAAQFDVWNLTVYRTTPCPALNPFFSLQPYLATRTIGENLRLAGASPYFVSTHPTEAVEILVQDAGLGSPAHVTRMLHVDRQATNATRGLVLQGVDLEEGDVITITGVLHAPAVPAAGLNMRLQSVATTGYMPNNPGGVQGVGAFEFVYTVSADHAGRANQAMRILAHGEGVAAQFDVWDITISRGACTCGAAGDAFVWGEITGPSLHSATNATTPRGDDVTFAHGSATAGNNNPAVLRFANVAATAAEQDALRTAYTDGHRGQFLADAPLAGNLPTNLNATL